MDPEASAKIHFARDDLRHQGSVGSRKGSGRRLEPMSASSCGHQGLAPESNESSSAAFWPALMMNLSSTNAIMLPPLPPLRLKPPLFTCSHGPPCWKLLKVQPSLTKS